ncbi:MAG: cell wall metabolism sensor histidine kinase WalK [Chloroflexota bacterium]|nr:cell wall metabolism sensor histidine kinase WalK [Chloroflexota bacterium]
MLEPWIAVVIVLTFLLLLAGLLFVGRPDLPLPIATLPVPQADIEFEQRLSSLRETSLDLSNEAVFLLDGDRRVMFVNRVAREWFRVEEGHPLIEALRDHDLENLLRRSIAQGEEQSAVVRLSRPQRVVRAVVRPVSHVGVVMVLADVTEIEHLQQVRRELVANISHELRTPLATLQLLVETLIEGAAEDEEARALFLGKLHEQVAHMSDIVEQSLALAALESGEARMMAAAVSVRHLLERSADRLKPHAEQAGLRVILELPDELPRVRADFDQISRVITNVLDNAIKVTPRGGEIRLGAAPEGRYVRVAIRDTGPGIPKQRLPRLFERFYTGDEARTGRSTGLGLAIAKHTVHMHGGQIWAESEEGKGASFYFTLPVAET